MALQMKYRMTSTPSEDMPDIASQARHVVEERWPADKAICINLVKSKLPAEAEPGEEQWHGDHAISIDFDTRQVPAGPSPGKGWGWLTPDNLRDFACGFRFQVEGKCLWFGEQTGLID